MNIIIENIRSFHDTTIVPVTPLTFLVGENSAGKSTFLAILSAMAQSVDFPFATNFSKPPYDLGTFDNIVTRNAKSHKSPTSFKCGFSTSQTEKGGDRKVVATYKGHVGQAQVAEVCIDGPQGSIHVRVEKKNAIVRMETIGRKSKTKKAVEFSLSIPDRESGADRTFLGMFFQQMLASKGNDSIGLSKLLTPETFPLLHGTVFPYKNVLSIAPIRTRPRRTYDQFDESFMPEGDHIPLILASIFEPDDAEGKVRRDSIKRALRIFGKDSGLFDTIEIKRLGKGTNSPFQVSIQLDGLDMNLIDVGYGVSQGLPIIVQSLISNKGGMLLLQQPEVHLHPRAQAALGSLFAAIANAGRLRFVIETHSDYLLDRVRTQVAMGKIQSKDVSILYFEKIAGVSTVHPISLDTNGNIIDAPPGYRNFFLKEELELLSRGNT